MRAWDVIEVPKRLIIPHFLLHPYYISLIYHPAIVFEFYDAIRYCQKRITALILPILRLHLTILINLRMPFQHVQFLLLAETALEKCVFGGTRPRLNPPLIRSKRLQKVLFKIAAHKASVSIILDVAAEFVVNLIDKCL